MGVLPSLAYPLFYYPALHRRGPLPGRARAAGSKQQCAKCTPTEVSFVRITIFGEDGMSLDVAARRSNECRIMVNHLWKRHLDGESLHKSGPAGRLWFSMSLGSFVWMLRASTGTTCENFQRNCQGRDAMNQSHLLHRFLISKKYDPCKMPR